MKNRLSKAIAIFLAFCVAFSGLPFLAGNLEANALAKKKKLPKNITLQAAVSGQTQVNLKWNKIKSPSKGYAVFRDGEPVKHFNTKKIAFTDKDLEAGTAYTYQIKTYTKKTVKMWFNKKTKKWQKKKPAKKYRGKSRKEAVYTYKKKSNAVTIHTAAAPAPSTPTDTGDTGNNDSTGGNDNSDSAQTTYTITWVNWNGKVLATSTVKAGEVPSYSGTPKRAADDNSYDFTGWSPAVVAANGDATYTAQFKATPRYTITWKDWDGTTLRTDIVKQGTKPIYPGTPSRSEDTENMYIFKGWSPAVTAAFADAVYTAQYNTVDKNSVFTVTWKNWDGTVIKTDTVNAGVTPAYAGKTPARPSDDTYRYVFKGWSPDIVPVMEDVSYQAQYLQKDLHTFTIKWVDRGTGDVLEIDEVNEGEVPTYNGPTPTKNSYKEENFTWTYTFAGWFPGVRAATEDITYYTSFAASAEDISVSQSDYYYNVHFLNEPYGNSETWNFDGKEIAEGGGRTVFYLETNNTNDFGYLIYILDSNGKKCNLGGGTVSGDRYEDLDVSKLNGELYSCQPACTGSCTIIISEYSLDTNSERIVKEIPVYLRDWNAEEKAWRQSIIKEVEAAKPSMTNAEKMQAICDYILYGNTTGEYGRNFSYYKVPVGSLPGDGKGYIFLISDEGVPFWKTKRLNSYTSPAILVEFGKDLDYPLHNCYGDYETGTPEWYDIHMKVYSEADDKYFEACPSMHTGYYDEPIVMFDPATYHFWGE
ncbi:MAG: hypothetical protein IKA24_03650 [Mogibacterium sp.]|nr:hypothetical protein [Mogibacterium sp.]